MPESAPDDPKLRGDPMLHRVLADVARTGSEMEQKRSDALLAKERLFPLVEDCEGDSRRLICYLTGPALGNIDLSDAAPIGSMLDAIGTCDNLDLMLNSPGGSGETAEKIVEMCRDHCRKEFRVIVPNYAKSAGTLISLGADRVVMGYLSELGPIDPQILIAISGVQQSVSGQSFIQAYEMLQEQIQEAMAAGESPVGYLQSLNATSMEPGFIEHCRRGVDFSRDIARKFLPQYQLKAKYKGKKGFGKKKLEQVASLNRCNFAHGAGSR